MRRISFARYTTNSLLVALLFVAPATSAARRPRYGGTLKIDLQGRVTSLDPAQKQGSVTGQIAQDRLLELISDRLVKLDQFGEPKPALAISWQHNDRFTHWEFDLRPNVKFQNATPITSQAVANSLQAVNPGWHVTAANDSVAIESDSPSPEMLHVLAETKNSILLRQADGKILGTGAFRLTTWVSGKSAVFMANDDYWGGRPFVDSIDVQMGRTTRERMIDLDLGKADIADIAPDRARIDASRGVKISTFDPAELVALVFESSSTHARDIRIRHALSVAIDRASLVDFVFQKEGMPAGGLLPQWSSGYAFLFSVAPDPVAARQLASQISPVHALKVGYDAADPMERMIAERIAVNAQAVGFLISSRAISADSVAGTANRAANLTEYDARIVRLPMSSPAPGAALENFLQTLVQLGELEPSLAAPLNDPANPEQLYSRERAVVDSYEVIPLVHVPEVVGLSARVRDWMPARWGAWRISDVWLDGAPQ
ncbi:MAG TPA: ABC transporter substrate-binding protein [Candidatus Acidoferrales bacterium]|nr:ABC transporter substrate-binding protein [Candidatus Acidoferrales bacterium]